MYYPDFFKGVLLLWTWAWLGSAALIFITSPIKCDVYPTVICKLMMEGVALACGISGLVFIIVCLPLMAYAKFTGNADFNMFNETMITIFSMTFFLTLVCIIPYIMLMDYIEKREEKENRGDYL